MLEPIASFNSIIDYNDIKSTEIIKLINEKALMQENEEIKQAYLYDYLIQIDLTTVNGLSIRSEEHPPTTTIANIFYKVSISINNLVCVP